MGQSDKLVSQVKERSFLFGYGLALATTTLAALVRWLLPWALTPAPYLGFYPAVVVSAALGGVGPGLAATFGPLFLVNFVFGRFDPSDSGAMMRQVIWVASSVGVSLLAGKLSDARERAKQETAAMRESEERLRSVLQSSSMGTFEIDLQTGEGRWNDVEYELLGLKPGEIPGNPDSFFRYVHPDDIASVTARWEEALRIGELDTEFRIVRADGRERWLAGKGRFGFADVVGGRAVRFMGVNFDITERKRAEEALRDSENRERERAEELATVLDAVPTPVFVAHDPECLHLSGNRAADELLRNPRGAEASLSASAETRPSHFKAVKDGRELRLDELPAQRAARGTRVENFEFSIVFDDGMTRQVLGYGSPLLNREGRPRGAVHVLVDITERKQAEAALQESEARFRTMTNAMPQLAWIARADGYIFWYNQRWYDYTGTTPEQMEGWGWQSVHDPNELPKVLERWQASIAAGETFDMTFPLRGADGIFRPFLTRGFPLKDSFGHVQQWFGTNTDVSELKRVEQALRVSEAMYRGIGESIDYGVWACAPDGRNTYASKSFLDMVGITQEQCSNFGWGNVLHPDDAERTIAAWQECVRTGGKWDIEHRFRGSDGQWHHVLARGVPVRNEQGEIIRWVGINLDICRLKQAEEQIKESLAEKEVMLKESHHRVKNNLQVISSLVGLQADGSKDEAVRQVLQDVTYRVRSMALVHEKLYQSADLAHIDFAEYTRGLLNYLWRAHGAIAAAVRMTLDLEPVSLPADTAVTCGLILNELAVNALEHAFQGRTEGEVVVSLHSGDGGQFRLCVSDNGVGLPAGFDWRRTRSLGLRLVQMLSGQLDATVQVNSGDGTKFEIVFGCPDSSARVS